jgi:hypothetical protein
MTHRCSVLNRDRGGVMAAEKDAKVSQVLATFGGLLNMVTVESRFELVFEY